jgi:hypothetical protein
LESAEADLAGPQEVIVGATVSSPVIVTVNEHCVPTSVEQITVVVPTGKKEPDGGLQIGRGGKGGSLGSPPQLPVVVGVV